MSVDTLTMTAWPTVAERAERLAEGKAMRKDVPLESLGIFEPAQDRRAALDIIMEQDASRLPFLVSVRHSRMAQTPFTFYRGAAAVMASDLSAGVSSTLHAQICGDAHLSNFGVYASPERDLVFDVNDFDETLAGPVEWDLKRLVTSLVVAARNNGLPEASAREIARAACAAYRHGMRQLSDATTLDSWYRRITIEEIEGAVTKTQKKTVDKLAAKARTRDSLQALGKLTTCVDGKLMIVSQPPLIWRLAEAQSVLGVNDYLERVQAVYSDYRTSVRDDVKGLLDNYEYVDSALKVVGVGSVGSRAFVMLLKGRDDTDVLFLQVKEAFPSVLERYLTKSPYQHHGQRVVEGQRLMQSVSDIFLGWATGPGGISYYWRQFKDWKGSVVVEELGLPGLLGYGRLCAATLAKSHARSSDPIKITGYLGKKETFDLAIEQFAIDYADQNERDYEEFRQAARDGQITLSTTY